MEDQIARFLIRAAKFEFYLVYSDRSLAQTREIAGLAVMTGVNWGLLAHKLEAVEPFGDYDFGTSPFGIFRETVPQFLVLAAESRLTWDSEEVAINSWAVLLTRGYSQLRNNIAHGNKAFPPAPSPPAERRSLSMLAIRLSTSSQIRFFGTPTGKVLFYFVSGSRPFQF